MTAKRDKTPEARGLKARLRLIRIADAKSRNGWGSGALPRRGQRQVAVTLPATPWDKGKGA